MYPSIHPSIYVSIYPSIHPSIYGSIYQIDALQRRLIESVAGIYPRWGELVIDFVRRRAVAVACIQANVGQWSGEYSTDLRNWKDHCVHGLWSGPLLAWHNEEWLQQCRVAAYRGGSTTRTGTRAAPGGVPRRWLAGLNSSH